MDTKNTLTCSVNTDLMLLYASGRTSPETRRAIESHIAGCQACARAFAREPGVRGNIRLPERAEPGRTDQTWGSLVHALLLSWAFVLYLCSRALALLNKPLRRLGVPANGLMIRLYRTRRKLADRLIESDPAAAQTASAG